MPTPIFQVDAFTDRPFTGNPAAVCLLAGPADDNWMQAVAKEMNLSETAFLIEEGDGHQVSARGGGVHVRVAGDRAILGGRAVTVVRGELAGEGR